LVQNAPRSATIPSGANAPDAMAPSIMALAMRSFMLPVGLCDSSLSRMRAAACRHDRAADAKFRSGVDLAEQMRADCEKARQLLAGIDAGRPA
jgi:hypothetical protein